MRKVQNFVFDFCNSAAVVKVNKKKEVNFCMRCTKKKKNIIDAAQL